MNATQPLLLSLILATGLNAQSFTKGPSNFYLNSGSFSLFLVDIDQDGDADAFSTSGNGTYFWKNNGSASAPTFAPGATNFGLNAGKLGIALVDLDNDGDKDAFAVDATGTKYWQNTGSASAPAFSAGASNFGLNAGGLGISFVDIDNDGDMDVFTIDNMGTKFWQNTGSANSPAFALSNSSFGLNAGANSLYFVDIDSDGDKDAFLIDGTGTRFWKNTGTSATAIFTTGSSSTFGLNAGGTGICFVDIDNDGDQDAFTIDGTGTIFWKNGTLTGINENQSLNDLTISPNPFSTVSKLSVGKYFSSGELTISNLQGKEVSKEKFLAGEEILIQRNDLTSGIYILTIVTGKQAISKKLIVE